MAIHPFSEEVMFQRVVDLLAERGVKLADIADLVLILQESYIPGLSREECLDSVKSVLVKREVQNALLTGIQLDMSAERGQLLSPLQEIVAADEALYGIDEVLALAIVNLYGSIGFTNFGYADRVKPGILHHLNSQKDRVHTFLDDLIAAVAAAVSSRLAHRHQRQLAERQPWRNNSDRPEK